MKEPVVQDSWTDPATGLTVPLEPDQNLLWRADILEAAEKDPALQTDLYTACSQSIEFWILAFAWTVAVFSSDEEGKAEQAEAPLVPFVLYPRQMELVEKLYDCVDGGSELLIQKSRDTGASWTCLVVLAWFFLFRRNQSFLLLSRKEDAVDQLSGLVNNYPANVTSDAGTLFGKIDVVLSRLPEWMRPKCSRKKLHLVNQTNGSRIDGESANATAGTSDRRTALFMDEFSKVLEAESIKRSTRDVTACRIVVSTPNGAGTTFSKWAQSGTIEVADLMWYHIPAKARGLYVKQDELGRYQIRSPWYDHQCETRSPKEVAIEIDCDHANSGDLFFEQHIIAQHRQLFGRPHRATRSIEFKKTLTDQQVVSAIRSADLGSVTSTGHGPWKLWCNLTGDRPDQNRTYVFAVDISKGQGASNSVIAVACQETHEKVAEYADPNVPPYQLAKIVAAAALWFGGKDKRGLVIFERNGDPGIEFGRTFVHDLRYPNLYFDRQHGTQRQRVGKRYGFHSNTDKKAEILGVLRRAYATGKYINHSVAALEETLLYISYDGGGVGPAALVNEPDAARKAHGDRVIADMLLCWVMDNESRGVRAAKSTTPERTFGHRLAAFKRIKANEGKPVKLGSRVYFGQEVA